jgi:hypothetical protein
LVNFLLEHEKGRGEAQKGVYKNHFGVLFNPNGYVNGTNLIEEKLGIERDIDGIGAYLNLRTLDPTPSMGDPSDPRHNTQKVIELKPKPRIPAGHKTEPPVRAQQNSMPMRSKARG